MNPFAHGPRVTAIEADRAILWARTKLPGLAKIVVTRIEDDARIAAFASPALEANDLTVNWPVTGLAPGKRYRVTAAPVADAADDPLAIAEHVTFEFKTPPDPAQPSAVTLAIGSCANDKKEPENPVWAGILADRPDALALIGDTPYIDSTDLAIQRRRYHEFLSHSTLRYAMAAIPTYGLWDDHDFGKNDTDGRLEGKENARRAFIENNPQWSIGAGKDGAYTRFRLGGMDVFMLDCRWFAGTEPSFADPSKLTLLGKTQWEWLKDGLKSSTAPFKVLCSGMVWTDVVRASKPDFWGAYKHERSAVWDFIAKEKITGVVLVGGDIHRSRLVRFEPEQTGVPYPLYEVITSPLGQTTIPQGNEKDKEILADFPEDHMWATLTADTTVTPPRLTVRIMTVERGERLRRDL